MSFAKQGTDYFIIHFIVNGAARVTQIGYMPIPFWKKLDELELIELSKNEVREIEKEAIASRIKEYD